MLLTERERLRDEIETLAGQLGSNRTALIPILQELKRRHHALDSHAQQVTAEVLGLHPVEVNAVVSFYAFLGEQPEGRYVIRLCRTISCDMQGKDRLRRQLENDLGIPFGATTKDGRFTLAWANCVGMCDQGPALLVNDQVHTRVTPEQVHTLLATCRRSFAAQPAESLEVSC